MDTTDFYLFFYLELAISYVQNNVLTDVRFERHFVL